MTGTEILKTIYSPEKFPLSLLDDPSLLTETNLFISEIDITFFREKCQKIDLDVPKFRKTLIQILDGADELLKARAVALIFMLKNVIDVSQLFDIILDQFNFNRQFFEELKNHQKLMLDVVEEIRVLLHSKKFNREDIFPIVNLLYLANEDSPNPLSIQQMKMIEPSEVDEKQKQHILQKYPIILPFEMKYGKYLKGEKPEKSAIFSVDRYDILRTVWTLDSLQNTDVKFCVVFKDEDEVTDQGDLTREFIDIAFHKIVDSRTDLFVLYNGHYWFKYHEHLTSEILKHYQCAGTLLALALLNRLTIPIHFPRYFYKRLLYKQATLGDLAIFDPSLYQSVKAIENNTVTGKIPLDFIYIDPVENYEIDLTDFKNVTDDKNFKPTQVVNENKGKFIDHLLLWIFEKSCQKEFKAFEEGFNRVTRSELLFKDFSLGELDEIVTNKPVFIWSDLKNSAKYEKPFTADSRPVRWFWKYFDEIDDNQKFSFIKFATGSTSIPKGGIKDIVITFKKSDENAPFPVAVTDNASIYLPSFKSYDLLVEKFNEQININMNLDTMFY